MKNHFGLKIKKYIKRRVWPKMRFSRLEQLIGKDALSFLQTKKIAVIGCGGVGGYVIEALARSALGTLIFIDFDVVEESNCNRQLVALTENLGKSKVECFAKRILEINPTCQVIPIQVKLTEENISNYISPDLDYVVDACDDVKVKKALLKRCQEDKIPFLACMGTGNRLDPSQLEITTLDKTQNDPLARIMRKYARSLSCDKKTYVCASKELPQKQENQVIASSAFVPSSAGILMASFVVRQILKESK